MKDVFIYDALRTPRGKGRKDGSLHEVTASRLFGQCAERAERAQQSGRSRR